MTFLLRFYIGYPTFHFRPSNSEQDINLTDFHYSRPSNKISMLHISGTRRFFYVLVIFNVMLRNFTGEKMFGSVKHKSCPSYELFGKSWNVKVLLLE